jgi:hypothetical protein
VAVVTVTSEGLAKLVLAALQAEIAAAINVVEAYWAAPDAPLPADPIVVPDPVSWEFGYRVSLLDDSRQFADLPVVAVFEGDEVQEPEICPFWPHDEGTFIIFVAYYVADEDEETCSKKRSRYTQAIKLVLRDHHNLMGCNNLTYQPRVELTPFIRAVDHKKDDLQRLDQKYFIQGALLTTVWRF